MTSARPGAAESAALPGADALARRVVAAATACGRTVAVAESLTGGLVTTRIVDVPGASAVLRGGVVAYATDVKGSVLSVDSALLAERGAVDAEVAGQMAEGVRQLLGADLGVATTGVAGPEPQDGHDVGTVHVAVSGPAGVRTRSLQLDGDREAIRACTVQHALDLLASSLLEAGSLDG